MLCIKWVLSLIEADPDEEFIGKKADSKRKADWRVGKRELKSSRRNDGWRSLGVRARV
jgi:hypothetical protein